jgi:hypothetical protein
MSHPIVFFEIAGPEGQKLQDFYRDTFGWTAEPNAAAAYAYMNSETPGIKRAGIRQDPPGTLLYIGTSDMDESVKKITDGGGTLIMKPTTIPGSITFALFKDPAGNMMGLLKT